MVEGEKSCSELLVAKAKAKGKREDELTKRTKEGDVCVCRLPLWWLFNSD